MTLVQMKCKPLAAGDPPLSSREAKDLLPQLPGWTLTPDELTRDLVFADFIKAMAFVNRIAGLAERENHHPGIHIDYNKVRLTLRTHKINGLSLNDFILAAKANRVIDSPDSGGKDG
jgi:4a-hydroxytetrahydrobiopterin dehydratase